MSAARVHSERNSSLSLHQAPARSRRTHALIPAMVVGGPEERLMFHSSNGLIQDPMALYRAAKLTNVWSDEEKKTFREKYSLRNAIILTVVPYLPWKQVCIVPEKL